MPSSEALKWIAYNLLFALAFPFMLPGFLLRMLRRGGYRARMLDRFGIYPKAVVAALAEGNGFVWLHAVSVGEVQVAGQLMREWRQVEPGVRFCFSTTSSTGWRMAAREVSARDVLIYNPLDFPSFVKSALAAVRPRAIVLTESEIWPVFIRRAKKLGIPLFLVNARVSDRSAPRYKAARWFFRDVFGCFAHIFAQSECDRARLLAAGAPANRVSVTGSFKFDVARRDPAKEAELRAWIDPPVGAWILLGGSTWPGEDAALLRVYRTLAGTAVPAHSPRLVIAPRHFEKADAVEANIRRAGFACVRRSRGDRPSSGGDGVPPVFLADTTGELMGLYGIADAVFVGKSLCAHGSQNMIEPCLCGKPTVVGPYTENFRPVMSDLLEGGGIVQVADEAGLAKTIGGWFADGDGGLGARARRAVERRCGVVPKCVSAIASAIPKRPPVHPRHGGGSAWKGVWATLLFLAGLAGGVTAIKSVWTPPPLAPEAVEIPFKLLWTLSAHIAMTEKPDAKRVLLADLAAEKYRAAFEHAGLRCVRGTESGRYDIVLATGADCAWEAPLARLSRNGVLVWCLNVKDMSAADFRRQLTAFPCQEVHLWMPSEFEWVLAGRRVPRRLKLGAMLDFFTRSDAALADLAAAECNSLPELFASYVGTREEVMGAFAQGDLHQRVRPEFFVAKEIPTVDWITNDVDADIFAALGRDIHRVQVARRLFLEGSMVARTLGDGNQESRIDEVVGKWEAAGLHNGHDPMMLERLFRLQINATAMEQVGNFKGAASCYEMMLVIRPKNAAALLRYADCMRMLGKSELAVELKKKAKEMMK
ncbi:MAG: glycosyltransferase N-terminal domain-containing protein [Kiritimatiellia bacterium]